MDWFHLSHVLLVILLSVSQVSRAQTHEQDDLSENTTLGSVTTNATPAENQDTAETASANAESGAVDETKFTRRSRPYATSYHPKKRPISYKGSSSRVPSYTVTRPILAPSPMIPLQHPVRPLVAMPPPPAPIGMLPQLLNSLPSALSSLGNILNGNSLPAPSPPTGLMPSGSRQPSNPAPSNLVNALNNISPLKNLIGPTLSLLGPVTKSIMNLLPFGKNLMDLFYLARNVYRFIRSLLSNFNPFNLLYKLLGFIPKTIRRIWHGIRHLFSWIPRLFSRVWQTIKNLLHCIPRIFRLFPLILNCIRRIPQRLERIIDYFYRLCGTLEMLLKLLKQIAWSGLRLLANIALLPLRIITKTLGKIIFLPIKLLAEPVLALRDLLRVLMHPFRRFYHFVRNLVLQFAEDLYHLFRPIDHSPYADYLVELHRPPPIIRVYPTEMSAPAGIIDHLEMLLP